MLPFGLTGREFSAFSAVPEPVTASWAAAEFGPEGPAPTALWQPVRARAASTAVAAHVEHFPRTPPTLPAPAGAFPEKYLFRGSLCGC